MRSTDQVRSPRERMLISGEEARLLRRDSTFFEVTPRFSSAVPDSIDGSIPGAVRTGVESDLSAPLTELGVMPLPARSPLRRRMLAAGVRADRPVVVFTRDSFEFSTVCRAWFVLRWAGFEDVRVLDGGLPAWVRAGGTTTPIRCSFSARVEAAEASEVLRSARPSTSGVVAVLTARMHEVARFGTLLDARPVSSYQGALDSPRTGHLPHAVSAPWRELIDDRGLLIRPSALRKWFLARRAIGRQQVVAYCGGGSGSAAVVFAAATLGQRVALYAESWAAWAADPALPLELGATPSLSDELDPDCAVPPGR